MIDPLEAVIKFLRDRPELPNLNDQVSRTVRYGNGWIRNTPGLVIVMDGGQGDEYSPVHQLRIESRCYGNATESMDTWLALRQIGRDANRELVETEQGKCLVYEFLQSSGPSRIWDPDVQMEMLTGFWSVTISEVNA